MTAEHKPPDDWSAATWEGATREAMRRWAKLPLEQILAAQEEMAELAEALGHGSTVSENFKVAESRSTYRSSE